MEINFKGFDDDVNRMVAKILKLEKDGYRNCVRVMEKVVEKLKAEAIRRVPIDTGDLEKSFSTKIIEAATMDSVIGVVYIAANALASEYALAMHEWNYNLGPLSRAKQLSQPVTVGRKYLERALDENERAFGLFIYSKLRSYMR